MISVFRSVIAIWNGFLQSWFKMIKFFGWFLNLVRHLIPTKNLVTRMLNLFIHLFLTRCWCLRTNQILGVFLLLLIWQIIFLLQCFSLTHSQKQMFCYSQAVLTFPLNFQYQNEKNCSASKNVFIMRINIKGPIWLGANNFPFRCWRLGRAKLYIRLGLIC